MTDNEIFDYIAARCGKMPLSDGGCWPWVAFTSKDGYGQFHRKGKTYLAHREMARVTGWDIEGLTVDHLCFEPSCCNPRHLVTCTREENTRRARSAAWRAVARELYTAGQAAGPDVDDSID